MIFVVLGTQKFQLNRLLKVIDEEIEKGNITEEVFAQIGHSTYKPKGYTYSQFLDKDTFEEYAKQANLIITHSGVGSIISGISKDKAVIVYPRLAKYGEHVDNHQLDIAKAFSKKDYVLCCYENDSLYERIQESKSFRFEKYISQRKNIIDIINNYLDNEGKRYEQENICYHSGI